MDIADFSLDLFSLAGRNALVTGGNTGLGQAFSLALAKAGADVFAVGLAEDDGTTRRLIEDAGRRLEFVLADITQPGVPATVVRRCVATLGSVDILVNSAGTNSRRRPASSISRRVVPSSSARPTANTSAPALARATEKARPRPVLPPVTRALRPARENRSRLKSAMSMGQLPSELGSGAGYLRSR